MEDKTTKICLIVVGIILFFALAFWTVSGREGINNWLFSVQKADDRTNYATRKTVEDTCRAMIASYTNDKLMYEQYKNGEGEKRSWAEMAKTLANKTATNYNNYILKNSFVWEGNVPADILSELEYIQ